MKINQSDKYYFNGPLVWESLRKQSLDKEVAFINSFIKPGAKLNILDIGCGTGMHASELAKLGHTVKGIDLNSHMIDYAKSKYPICNFRQMNMLDISKLEGKYDIILCMCTTLCYITDDNRLNKFLDDVYGLLKTNGKFIFDVFNPISYLEKLDFKGNYFGEEEDKYHAIGLNVSVVHRINETNQILTETKTVTPVGRAPIVNKTLFRIFFPKELKLLLQLHSFTNIQQFGKYIRGYSKLDSTRIVSVCERPKRTTT